MDLSDLQTFALAYIEAALWTTSCEAEIAGIVGTAEDASLLEIGLTAGHLDSSARASVDATCEAFIRANVADLTAYCEAVGDWHGSDTVRGVNASYTAVECAGHDFLLTRCGTGTGFHERGLGELGDRLADAARAFGEVWFDATPLSAQPCEQCGTAYRDHGAGDGLDTCPGDFGAADDFRVWCT